MNILFIHQNFPGQYIHLAPYMQQLGHDVTGLGETKNIQNRGTLQGINTIGYPTPAGAGDKTHHYLQSMEAAVRRGQSVARSLLSLREQGYKPDAISLHPGWGEGLFVRDIFPDTPMLMFCEYYFRAEQADLAFDPEFPQNPDWSFSIRLRNSQQILSLITATACLSPTRWQASRYPDCIRSKIRVLHDGVDTDLMCPDRSDTLTVQPLSRPGESRIPGQPSSSPAGDDVPAGPPVTLRAQDKIISFVARNLEPYRGFHKFMRALPEVQRLHPDAHVLIVGHDSVSYSPNPPGGKSYKEIYLGEVKDSLDLTRVHFLGRITYGALRSIYRISSAHVYLTYPFVLSWSPLEAMACESLLVASDTEPVREVATHNKNALLVDFFDTNALVATLDEALRRPEQFEHIRKNARHTVRAKYDMQKCLKKQAELLSDLAARKFPAPW